MPRATGVVRKFIDQMHREGGGTGGGYGFIMPDEGKVEIFVHRSDLGQSCLQSYDGKWIFILVPGQKVSFEPIVTPRGQKATNVELVKDEAV